APAVQPVHLSDRDEVQCGGTPPKHPKIDFLGNFLGRGQSIGYPGAGIQEIGSAGTSRFGHFQAQQGQVVLWIEDPGFPGHSAVLTGLKEQHAYQCQKYCAKYVFHHCWFLVCDQPSPPLFISPWICPVEPLTTSSILMIAITSRSTDRNNIRSPVAMERIRVPGPWW